MSNNYAPTNKTKRMSSDTGVYVAHPPSQPHKGKTLGRVIGRKNDVKSKVQAQGKKIYKA